MTETNNNTAAQTTETLTASESSRLRACESSIRAGLRSFYNVGRALAEIRSNRLYRVNYSTFDAYADDKWDMTRARAAQLIFAAHLHDLLALNDVKPLPATESQCRPLASIPETETHSNDLLDCWLGVIEYAREEKVKITAKLVSTVVDKFLGKTPKPVPKPASTPATTTQMPETADDTTDQPAASAQEETGPSKEAAMLDQLRQAHARIAYLESALAAEKKAHQRTQAASKTAAPMTKMAKELYKAGFRVLVKQHNPEFGGTPEAMEELIGLRGQLGI